LTNNNTYDPDVAGTVLNIQRFSVHDGPGIRTVVFIKGCSLRCIWCSNPESMSRREQIGFYPDRCIGTDKCDACFKPAPDPSALVVENQRVTGLRAENPQEYLACAEACPTNALKVWGKRTSVGEVMQEVMADREFYEESGGGLTLSGGEALIQTRFAVELLKAARAEGINTCVETALNLKTAVLDAALPHIDLALCDLKHMDSGAHKRYTGVPNERILENLGRVADSGTPIVIRIPVVPGHNGTEENLRATAKFLVEKLGGLVAQVQLLPFRRLGVEKYASIGIPYPMEDFTTPPREQWEKNILQFAEMMCSFGLHAVAGSGARIPI
jgi:pyruvate formate lyase activating enzyme